MKCIVCEKPIPASEHVCSEECEHQWDLQQIDTLQEIECVERDRWEDPNAGCWSFTW
jgi:hypothetical protein